MVLQLIVERPVYYSWMCIIFIQYTINIMMTFFYQHVSEYLLETAGNLIVPTLAFSRL